MNPEDESPENLSREKESQTRQHPYNEVHDTEVISFLIPESSRADAIPVHQE